MTQKRAYSYGICACGCGAERRTRKDRLWKDKGFLPGHSNKFRTGILNHAYRGGLYFSRSLNRWIVTTRNKNKKVLWARVVMENKTGRLLTEKEVVHHEDEDSTNDTPDNLVLCATQAEHAKMHRPTEGKYFT